MSTPACYRPNGTNTNAALGAPDGWLYATCHPDGSPSMCCAVGPGRNGTQDVCLPNGLCSNNGNVIWRESCTDPTWKDPACLKLFVNGTGINATMGTVTGSDGEVLGDVTVTQCDVGSYCYGTNNRACCQQGHGVFLLNGEQVTFNPNATTTTSAAPSTSTNASSSASASSSPPTATASSHGGLSTGAEAGIGVGAAVGGILILVLLFLCFRRRKRRARSGQPAELGGEPAPAMLETQQKHELSSDGTAGKSENTDSSRWSGSNRERYNRPAEMLA